MEDLTNPSIWNGRGLDLAQYKKDYLIIRTVQNENMPPTKEAVFSLSLEVLKQRLKVTIYGIQMTFVITLLIQ